MFDLNIWHPVPQGDRCGLEEADVSQPQFLTRKWQSCGTGCIRKLPSAVISNVNPAKNVTVASFCGSIHGSSLSQSESRVVESRRSSGSTSPASLTVRPWRQSSRRAIQGVVVRSGSAYHRRACLRSFPPRRWRYVRGSNHWVQPQHSPIVAVQLAYERRSKQWGHWFRRWVGKLV